MTVTGSSSQRADRPSIGAAIIAKNEERCLERCLRSVSWVDEIVLVDDCSTDRTPEIARRFGCRVIVQPMRDFAHQRNLALQHSACDWVLHIDADEECGAGLREEVLAAIRNTSCAGFSIPFRNRFLGRVMRGRGWADARSVRLGKRSGSSWANPVHERLCLEGPIGSLRSPLEHHGESDYAGRILKSNRYTSMEAALLAQRGVRFHPWLLLTRPLFRSLKSYLLDGGWRDGIHGLIWAGHVWSGNFNIYVKLWELERSKNDPRHAPRAGET